METLSESFISVHNSSKTFEWARDKVRCQLNDFNNTYFPNGSQYTYIDYLMECMMGNKVYGRASIECTTCSYNDNDNNNNNNITFGTINTLFTHEHAGFPMNRYNMNDAIQSYLSRTLSRLCRNCIQNNMQVQLKCHIRINSIPDILVLEALNYGVKPTLELTLTSNSGPSRLLLTGIIYGDGNHFVCRLIDKSGLVWLHDGMVTGSTCKFEQRVDLLSDLSWLRKQNEKKMLYCIYQTTRAYNNE